MGIVRASDDSCNNAPREVLEARMPEYLARRSPQRDRPRIVVKTAERHPAKVP